MRKRIAFLGLALTATLGALLTAPARAASACYPACLPEPAGACCTVCCHTAIGTVCAPCP